MRVSLLLPLLVAAFAVAGSASARGSGLHDLHPCTAAGYTCATLDVPLDHAHPGRGTLHLRVGLGDNVHASHGVLLVLSGGPGQPGLPILDGYVSKALAAEQSQYRIVVFDQRGTGAGALDCEAMQHEMGSSDLTPPKASAVRACARKLGARRQFFGTDDVVSDMEALRQALGVDKWSLDGISYGTYVGERYALAYPSHVSKLVLDSVVPQVGETDLGVAEFAAVQRVLHSVCGARCVSDLAAVVRRDRLGPQLFDALTFDSIADPTYRKFWDVPAALHAARHGHPTQLDKFLAAASHFQRETPAAALDQGLHASALCGDWRYPWGTSAAPLAGRAAKLGAAIARIPPHQRLYPFDAKTASGNGFVRQCLPWAPTKPTPLPHGKLQVPTLLVNGNHDLSTPLAWARRQLSLTPHGKLVVVPGAGHSVQSRAVSDVGRRAVAHFLLGS